MTKYITVFNDNRTCETSGYKGTLSEVALELNVREDQLLIEPDDIDGDHYEEVSTFNHATMSTEVKARIYTEAQYANRK